MVHSYFSICRYIFSLNSERHRNDNSCCVPNDYNIQSELLLTYFGLLRSKNKNINTFLWAYLNKEDHSQLTCTYSKSTIETLKKGVKYVQS